MLAMGANDNAGRLTPSGVSARIASMLAPPEGECTPAQTKTPGQSRASCIDLINERGK